MVDVKDMSTAQSNYEKSALGIAPKYIAGVKKANWSENASSDEAEALYQAKLQESMARKARQKGIQKVSNAEWQNRTADKGGKQIASAMAVSGGKWARGFQPFKEALEGVSLPPRTADPVTNVTQRVIPIVQALVDKKKALQSS